MKQCPDAAIESKIPNNLSSVLSATFKQPSFESLVKPSCGLPDTPCCNGQCRDGTVCQQEGPKKM